jgi:hypothetical protein
LQIKNTTVKNHKYRLVFMASKETKDSCYIVTAFDKFRVQLAAPPRPDAIQVSNLILWCEIYSGSEPKTRLSKKVT